MTRRLYALVSVLVSLQHLLLQKSLEGRGMTSNSFQNEVPKTRVNITLDLHTGSAQKKVELPLKLMVMGDYSNGEEQRKVNVHKKNFNSVLRGACPAAHPGNQCLK